MEISGDAWSQTELSPTDTTRLIAQMWTTTRLDIARHDMNVTAADVDGKICRLFVHDLEVRGNFDVSLHRSVDTVLQRRIRRKGSKAYQLVRRVVARKEPVPYVAWYRATAATALSHDS